MIQAIVLDIEGTTCPVDFVSHTLFPFAQKNLEETLNKRSEDTEINALVNETISEWITDSDPTSQRSGRHPTTGAQVKHSAPTTAARGDQYLQAHCYFARPEVHQVTFGSR